MVMDAKDARKPLNEWDWRVLGGHDYIKKNGPTLPRCRLDIPLPSTLDEVHTLAHMLAALSQQLGTEVRLANTTRQGMSQVKGLINQFRLRFADLGKEWETTLREEWAESKAPAETVEQLRAVK